MAYLGNNFSQQGYAAATDFFSGNGVTTTFTLTRPLQSVYGIEVVVNNVRQNPSSTYTINASNQIVFVAAPSTGSNNIYVSYNAPIAQITSVGQGTIGQQQLGSIPVLNSVGSNMTLQTNGITGITIDQNQNITVIGRVFASSTQLQLGTNSALKITINSAGSILPATNDAQDLGSTSTALRNVYTKDLHLNNETKVNGNDVDGTTGNWTIQEGAENLYIINNKTGKRYAFMLREIE
jgi:hypothetical protein